MSEPDNGAVARTLPELRNVNVAEPETPAAPVVAAVAENVRLALPLIFAVPVTEIVGVNVSDVEPDSTGASVINRAVGLNVSVLVAASGDAPTIAPDALNVKNEWPIIFRDSPSTAKNDRLVAPDMAPNPATTANSLPNVSDVAPTRAPLAVAVADVLNINCDVANACMSVPLVRLPASVNVGPFAAPSTLCSRPNPNNAPVENPHSMPPVVEPMLSVRGVQVGRGRCV